MTAIFLSRSFSVERHASAYIQIGDLVQMLLDRSRPRMITCNFCRTMNHVKTGACTGCGWRFPEMASPDIRPKSRFLLSRDTKIAAAFTPSGMKILSVVLFLFFACSFAYYSGMHGAFRVVSDISNPEGPGGRNPGDPMQSNEAAAPELAAAEEEALASSKAALAKASSAATTLQSGAKPEKHPMQHGISSAAPHRVDLLAPCRGFNFMARAICINDKCAERRHAADSQCAEPLRRRRIDEARRNSI